MVALSFHNQHYSSRASPVSICLSVTMLNWRNLGFRADYSLRIEVPSGTFDDRSMIPRPPLLLTDHFCSASHLLTSPHDVPVRRCSDPVFGLIGHMHCERRSSDTARWVYILDCRVTFRSGKKITWPNRARMCQLSLLHPPCPLLWAVMWISASEIDLLPCSTLRMRSLPMTARWIAGFRICRLYTYGLNSVVFHATQRSIAGCWGF
jgi:hypothetical protein